MSMSITMNIIMCTIMNIAMDSRREKMKTWLY